MRLTALTVAVSMGLLASSAVAQRTDDQVLPRSVEILKTGEAALAAGRFQAAEDAFETALAVDPSNRAAYVLLSRASMKQRLFGQAIRYANKALELEPTDRDALAAQGEAMVQLGALPRARDTLAKLKKVCAASDCPQAASLSAAIARGPVAAPATGKRN